jgi:hypothetical protein
MGKNYKPWTGIAIGTDSSVCLALDYFMNDKNIEDRVVNVPKGAYFGV